MIALSTLVRTKSDQRSGRVVGHCKPIGKCDLYDLVLDGETQPRLYVAESDIEVTGEPPADQNIIRIKAGA